MIILAVDSCWQACSAALARSEDGEVKVLAEAFEPMQTGQAERLPAMVEELFEKCELSPKTVERVAVANGPGSFTGVRIAIALARAVQLATGADIVTCSSLELIARGLPAKAMQSDCAKLLVAMDARRNQVYAQWFSYDAGPNPMSPPELISVADLAESCGQSAFAVAGTGARAVVDAMQESLGAYVASVNPLPNAKDLIALAATEVPITTPLEPVYLRPPDAKLPSNPAIARI